MKRISMILVSLLVMTLSINAQNLVASYAFDEGVGVDVADDSGNELDATLNENIIWAIGKSGSAVELADTNILLPSDIRFSQSTFTIATWMKLTVDPRVKAEWYPVFTNDFGGGNEIGLLIGDGGYVVLHAPGVNLGEVTSWNNDEVVAGTWAHVAVTVDADGNGKVYVNGVETASATGGTALTPAVAPTYLCGAQDDVRDFSGIVIDDFQFYDDALSADAIAVLAEDMKSGLVASWFEQVSGTTTTQNFMDSIWQGEDIAYEISEVVEIADLSGNGLNLNMVKMADSSWVYDAEVGNTVVFNGLNQFGIMDSLQSKAFEMENFSIGTYVKIDSEIPGYARIAGIGSGFGFNINDAGFIGMWCNHGTGWHGSYSNLLPVNDGEWHYVGMSHDNAKGNVFYVDGQVVLEQDWSSEDGNQIVFPGNDYFAVGIALSDWEMENPVALVAHDGVPGALNSLKVYNKVLSKDDLSGVASGLVAHYDYEGVDGYTLPDLTANMLDGFIANSKDSSSIVEGKYSASALALTNTHIRLPDDIAFTNSTFTFATWMKLTVDPRVKAEWYPVFTNDFGGDNECGLLIGDGGYVVLHAPGVGLGEVTSWTNDEVAVGTWAHVAVTVDADGKGVVYLDGVEVASADGGHLLPNPSKVSATYIAGAANPVRDFSGIILDDSRYYNRALTGDEILLLASTSYKLDITVVGLGTVSPAGGNYMSGTEVELTATPNDGQIFVGWTGDVESTDNPLTVTMDSDVNLTATFEVEKFALTVTIVGNGTVTPGTGDYSGTQMLTATADDGWEFEGWSEDLSGTDNPAFIEMSEARAVTATFTEIVSIDESIANVSLSNNPNPFTNVTTIKYSINEASDVNLTVYDVFGKVVKVMVNENRQAGDHSVELDASSLPAGIYIYKLQNGKYSIVKRMILSK